MSWAITAAVGISAYSAYQSSRASDRAAGRAAAADTAALEFERQRYEDWKSVYGGLQENLSSYYSSLTPEMYAQRGLEQFQREQENALARAREALAIRGIDDSGIIANVELQSELRGAETRASIRSNAEDVVREAKTGFLQIGLGQNPANSVGQVLQNQAASRNTYALAAEQASGTAWGSTANLLTNQLMRSAQQPTTVNQTSELWSGSGVWSRT